MTKFLLKNLQKRYPDANSAAYRTAVGSLSGRMGLFCNLLLFGGKLFVGLVSGSVAIMADALNNLTDCASTLVTLLGFKLAGKPADTHHPYGHARYEYIAALTVAALILVVGYELAKSSVEKIITPTAVALPLPMALVLVAAIGVKGLMYFVNRGLGKAIGSAALTATAADSRNDCIATGATLIAALLETTMHWRVDGIMGLAVAVFVLYSGVMLAKETVSTLLGEAADPELREKVLQEMESDPRILGHHDLMVHDYGPGQRFGSIHLEMDCREDPLTCHALIDRLEHTCLQKFNLHMVIHYDPILTDDPVLGNYREAVAKALSQVDDRLTFHDLHLDGKVLHLDVKVCEGVSREEVTQAVETALPHQEKMITFDLL